jgi:hypothetical protein
MNLLSKKSIIKTGIAAAAVTVAALNFSQAESVKTLSAVKVSEANAQGDVCISAPGKICIGYSNDGIYHEVADAENP